MTFPGEWSASQYNSWTMALPAQLVQHGTPHKITARLLSKQLLIPSKQQSQTIAPGNITWCNHITLMCNSNGQPTRQIHGMHLDQQLADLLAHRPICAEKDKLRSTHDQVYITIPVQWFWTSVCRQNMQRRTVHTHCTSAIYNPPSLFQEHTSSWHISGSLWRPHHVGWAHGISPTWDEPFWLVFVTTWICSLSSKMCIRRNNLPCGRTVLTFLSRALPSPYSLFPTSSMFSWKCYDLGIFYK